MSSIDPSLAGRVAAPAPALRQDISFTQRHAWMREYENAEHGARSVVPADRAETAARGMEPTRIAGDASVQHEPIGEATRVSNPAGPLASPAAASGEAQPSARAPEATRQAGITPTSVWLQPLNPRARLQALPEETSAPARARCELPAQPHAEREVTVNRAAETLSVTVRDTRLDDEKHGRDILRGLNASGASLGMKQVNVTVNGRSTEQRTPGNPEE